MKHFYSRFTLLLTLISGFTYAQQLPNNQFEDWSGTPFDGVAQPASWNYSNVTQLGFKFNFAHQETGRSGSCMMVQDQALKVAGIGETSPGYISLGNPWVYVESLTKISEATAGTYGGIAWAYRPDTMSVWIKRTGNDAMLEDFHLLYYAWSGTAYGEKYKGKNGNCTSVPNTDEESDIRILTNGNECGTATPAHQIAEGWIYGRAIYNDWVQVKVPIYYLDNTIPEKANVIFSASNYPNFRANSGLYVGNSLYVDDVELIYSSKIQSLFVDGTEWKGFNPNSTDIQYYSLKETEMDIPSIKAYRGAGQLTNSNGTTATFHGRQLLGDEITIKEGTIDQEPTTITVKAEDGSSETTYKILFMHKASNNAYLSGILVNGTPIKNFNPYNMRYTTELPYGTTDAPTISVLLQDDDQTATFTQPSSMADSTVIVVTAPDHKTTQTYVVYYKEAQLTDNTLIGIHVNGVAIPDFSPTKTYYKVSLPLGTTEMPVVEAISAYAKGAQTIVATAPNTIDGGVYQIAVSSPGNPTPKTYKITFKLEASTNCLLQNILLDGESIANFSPNVTTYYVKLPVGTTTLPVITWVAGDAYQTITKEEGGLNGTTRITVKAGDGESETTYRIVFSVQQSEISTLSGILIDGEPLQNFDESTTNYSVVLHIGTTELPTIEAIAGDPYQTIHIISGGLNGTTRITVTAGNGTITIYQITFMVAQSTDATLLAIYIDGHLLDNFDPNQLEYNYVLPQGTKELPVITYTPHDAYQTITVRSGGVNGDYKITVRPQSGTGQTYIIHFSVPKSDNTALKMIYLDGKAMEGFDPEQLTYIDTLSVNIIPTVSYDAYEGQKIISILDGNEHTIQVTAESGDSRTYTILFVVRKSENAFLKMIYLDGDSLDGFEAEKLSYSNLILQSKKCPIITVESDIDQRVCILSPAGAGTAQIIVTAAAGGQNIYILEFVDTTIVAVQPLEPDTEYVASGDVELETILVNGDTINGFAATRHHYSLSLEAGSKIPTIRFIAKNKKQSVVSGSTNDSIFTAIVTAESGDVATYQVCVVVAAYDNALLKDLQVEGESITFDPNTLDYEVVLGEGDTLPNISYLANKGQTIVQYAENDHQYKILVTAESGRQSTYTIHYLYTPSSNALLQDIRIHNTSIEGFDPHIFNYVDTLAWRSKVVPVVNAIGSEREQTITTYFSQVNGITRIHVVAADGKTTADYQIAFPVRKSGNVHLANIALETEYTADIEFDAEQTDYVITLPYNAVISPTISYEKAEQEQTISMTLREIGQPNEIKVRAENGDTRTYTITFMRAHAPYNSLQSIEIAELKSELNLSDSTKRTFTINLPYGTTTFTVSYTKRFEEQSVMVQPGGIYQPTILTVYTNDEQQQPTVYTLHPVVSIDPAQITELNVNGNVIEGFSSDRYSYIVAVKEKPIIKYTLAKGATINVLEQTNKHWMAEVKCNGHVNTYNVWYYYPDEIIPNAEFNEWTNCQTLTSAKKPTNWNTVADVVGTQTGFFSFTPDELVTKSGEDAVQLQTWYSVPGGGAIPGFITLGKVSGNWDVAGASNFEIHGGISFHNTPDIMQMKYYVSKIKKNNPSIQYSLTGTDGTHSMTWTDTETTSSYKVTDFNLQEANNSIGDPSLLNIIINSYSQVSGSTCLGYITNSELNTMYVDYIRFVYNNTLNQVFVNDIEAQKDGNQFIYTITDATETDLPRLTFQGAVRDQAQKVEWADPVVENGLSVRRATITNYGEDGSYSTYTLVVNRPIDTTLTLSNILVNNLKLADFKANQLDYIYELEPMSTTLPDIVPTLASPLQVCQLNYADSTVTIVVTSENKKTRTYTIRLRKATIENATLADIKVQGLSFDANQETYTLESSIMPEVSISKQYDQQIVHIEDGKIDVKMGNTEGHYQIILTPTQPTTSGRLTGIDLDGNRLADFATDKYIYEHDLSTWMNFTREFNTDSVIFTQTSDTLFWHVIGGEEHIYQLTTTDPRFHSTDLDGIYVNGRKLDVFSAQMREYIVESDSTFVLSIQVADTRQLVAITTFDNLYTITVTAPDGTTQGIYKVERKTPLSTDASLSNIELDGIPLSGFDSKNTKYTIVIPTGEYKDHEPQIPSIHYMTTNDKASVMIEPNGINATTYLLVTAQDGLHTSSYELNFVAEPSHNVSLSAIAVNDVPIEGFDSEQLYYSLQMPPSQITIDWRSHDRYQNISLEISNNQYIIHVVAQDGISKRDYVISILTQALSNDATLNNILLDGNDMHDYYADVNPNLAYISGLNTYTIYRPSGIETLPNVSALLKEDGQNVSIHQTDNTITIQVTAPNGTTTNTYVLHFKQVLSTNANLKMIYIDGDSLATFQPQTKYYFITLSSDQRTLPNIRPIGDKSQIINTTVGAEESRNQQVEISVMAEDQVSTSQYVLFFQFTPSDADTLVAILDEMNQPITGFQPHNFYYSIEIPYDTIPFPHLTWETADAYQTVYADTIELSPLKLVRQFVVTAENGRINRYTVIYSKLLSTNTYLDNIFINSQPVVGFNSQITEYIDTLDYGQSIDTIFWTLGDRYQTVTCKDSIDSRRQGEVATTYIQVTAQNGDTRIYTLHFVERPNQDSTLAMIYYNEKPVPNFDDEQYQYTIQMQRGETLWPAIRYDKKHIEQQVEVTYIDSTTSIQLCVTAVNKKAHTTYQLLLKPYLSDNGLLDDIYLDGAHLPEFNPMQDSYELTIDSLSMLPEITYELAESTQHVLTDTSYVYNAEQQPKDISFLIKVVPENQVDTNFYTITFHIKANTPLRPEESDNARLATIEIRGQEIGTALGFTYNYDPQVIDYYISYPIGSNPDLFYTDADVMGVPQDSLAKVLGCNTEIISTATDTAGMERAVHTCIHIIVVAPNQQTCTYNIYQKLELDSTNHTTELIISDYLGVPRPLASFEKDVYYYEYLLPNTKYTAPDFELHYSNTDSRFACASFERDNDSHVVDADDKTNYASVNNEDDPTFHLCYRAEDGTKYVYKIKFRRSEINRAQKPQAGDVLIQHIPGSHQIAVASLRANVTFALYSMNGALLNYVKLEENDPNSLVTTTDGYGQDYFGHLTDLTSCTILTLQPNMIYCWVFYENGKDKIKSGKLVINP